MPQPRALLASRLVFALLLTAISATLAACSGPDPKSVADWRAAVVAVRGQSDATFREVNELVRASQMRRVENLANLKESDFQAGLSNKSLAAWNRALDSLATYGGALNTLLSPDASAGVSDSIKNAGEQIAKTSRSKIFEEHPGVAGAMGSLGSVLVQAASRSRAQEIMVQADPKIRELLSQMGKMIDDDSTDPATGVRATVYTDWTTRANAERAKFLRAADAAEKRRIAEDYAQLLAERDAADQTMLALQRSLEDLAAAHTAAAQGKAGDLASFIASVKDQTALARQLIEDLKKKPA